MLNSDDHNEPILFGYFIDHYFLYHIAVDPCSILLSKTLWDTVVSHLASERVNTWAVPMALSAQ
jgi:hypothetical protein